MDWKECSSAWEGGKWGSFVRVNGKQWRSRERKGNGERGMGFVHVGRRGGCFIARAGKGRLHRWLEKEIPSRRRMGKWVHLRWWFGKGREDLRRAEGNVSGKKGEKSCKMLKKACRMAAGHCILNRWHAFRQHVLGWQAYRWHVYRHATGSMLTGSMTLSCMPSGSTHTGDMNSGGLSTGSMPTGIMLTGSIP